MTRVASGLSPTSSAPSAPPKADHAWTLTAIDLETGQTVVKDVLVLMGLKARFDALAIEQQEFAAEALASRLDPPEGNEPVEPRPRVLT